MAYISSRATQRAQAIIEGSAIPIAEVPEFLRTLYHDRRFALARQVVVALMRRDAVLQELAQGSGELELTIKALDKSCRAAEEAQAIIAGKTQPARAIAETLKVLHDDRQFGLARKMLDALTADATFTRELRADPKLERSIAQKHALSTSKDPDLPNDAKYAKALDLLDSADALQTSTDQETLGQAGGIHKRLWEHTGQERHLETSLAFYLRGYHLGVDGDFGYTSINAAFVLDVLADLESPDQQPLAAPLPNASARRSQASVIRKTIIESLTEWPETEADQWRRRTWWYLLTIAEAYFGIGDYAGAEPWLLTAKGLKNIPDWEQESSARQLSTLLHLQRRAAQRQGQELDPLAESVLLKFLDDKQATLETVLRGKVGLALSGGGFRASLFHIGVLARLAELDLLRHVEYLSCVSGGSIVGAHYYLEVRKLLQSKPDAAIGRQDYIRIVENLCRDFLAGVQRNIRVRIAAELWTNLKMIFGRDYSRTLRAGDLYESEIFARTLDPADKQELYLDELLIRPKNDEDCRPKDHNWRRAAKVPILILNATTLNTGHNWQFTASWMGEPPANSESEIDSNFRLRRMYYREAPPGYQHIRLGHAVAASACVPALFEPLTLRNLYERRPHDGSANVRPVVRLVDGGVYDNQGTSALLEQGCSVLLVSDASGQMNELDDPSEGLLGVPLRANSILQARVRVSQFEDLDSRRRAGIVKGSMFVHLKKGLTTQPVDWVNSQDPSPPVNNTPLTAFDVQKQIQRKLAAVRTDLDSFSDAEAYALMASAYLMTSKELEQPELGFPLPDPESAQWKFLDVKDALADSNPHSWLSRQLGASDRLALKVWLLDRNLQIAAGFAAVLLLGFVAVWSYQSRAALTAFLDVSLLSPRTLLWTLLGAILTVCGMKGLARLLGYRKTLQQMLIGLGMSLVGFLLARLHLHVFDRLFLRQGRLPKSMQASSPAQSATAARTSSSLVPAPAAAVAVSEASRQREFATRLFGYDVFVSFALGSAPRGTHRYAADLTRQLRSRGLTVFFCEDELPPGHQLTPSIKKALARSKCLAVVLNRDTVFDPRWVQKEVQTFAAIAEHRPIVPIGVDGCLDEADVQQAAELWLVLKDTKYLNERGDAVAQGAASAAVVQDLISAPHSIKVRTRFRALVGTVCIVLVGLAATAMVTSLRQYEELKRSVSQQLVTDSRERMAGPPGANVERGMLQLVAAERLSPSVQAQGLLLETLVRTQDMTRLIVNGGRVMTLDVSKSGHIITGSDDASVRTWDLHSGTLQATSKVHTASVTSVDASPDGVLAASGSEDGSVRLWHVRTLAPAGKPLIQLPSGISKVTFDATGQKLLATAKNGEVRVWEVGTRRILIDAVRHADTASSAAFNADGSLFVSANHQLIQVWSVATGKPEGAGIKVPHRRNPTDFDTDIELNQVSFSPDDRSLMVAFGNVMEPEYQEASSKEMAVWSVGGSPEPTWALQGHQDEIRGFVFSPDGRQLVTASGDSNLRFWDVATRQLTRSLRGHKEAVTSVAYTDDGKYVVSGSEDGTVRIWPVDPETTQLSKRLLGHSEGVKSIAFSPDGRYIVSGSDDHSLILWDAVKLERIGEPLVKHITEILTVAFSPDSKLIASGGTDGSVVVWDVASRRPKGPPLAHEGWVHTVAFSPDSQLLAAASNANTDAIVVWDLATSKPAMAPLVGHENTIKRVLFTQDGTRIISAGVDHTIRVWPIKPLAPPNSFAAEGEIDAAVLSCDGTEVWVASKGRASTGNNILRRWSIRQGGYVGQPMRGHQEWVSAVALSPDCRYAASVGLDRTLRIWDAVSGQPIGVPLMDHGRNVVAVAFSPDGRWIASGGYDNAVRLWPTPRFFADALCAKQSRWISKQEWTAWISPQIGYVAQCSSPQPSPDGRSSAYDSKMKP